MTVSEEDDSTAYPDLTAASASSLSELEPQALADMSGPLGRSRLAALPSPPAASGEPADFLAKLHGHIRTPSIPASFGSPSAADIPTVTAPHELGVEGTLSCYRSAILTPSQMLASLRPRWADHTLVGGAILAILDGLDDAAAESDRRWADGNPRPLEGIYFGVKDIIDVAEAPITCGSRTTGERIADTDATVVARLRAAGAIPCLVTATTEFACGAPRNARYGTVSNPWDRNTWTGGSSTGSAGALAAGLVPLALGTDSGGSIRIPSALCNLTGLKPTYGLVPRTGIASLSWSLDHVGPMARSAADLAIALSVMSGPDDHDALAAPQRCTTAATRMPGFSRASIDSESAPLAGIRFGLPGGWFSDLCDEAVWDCYLATADTLAACGAELVSVNPIDWAATYDEFTVLLTTELASNQEANLDRFDLFDIGTQVRIARGRAVTGVDYLRSLRRRGPLLSSALTAFDDTGIDVLVTPGVGTTAPRISDATAEINGRRHPMQSVIGRNTAPLDYLGLPAVMVPGGFADGMPVGVQIVGRPWADWLLLRLARFLQQRTDFHLRRPTFALR